MSLHPQVAALIDASSAALAQVDLDSGAQGLRAMMAAGAVGAQWDRATARDLTIPGRDGHLIALRVHGLWPRSNPVPMVLFFHGGGWATGDLDTHADTAYQLARDSDCIVVAVDYRLAPEHPFPAALHDCRDALGWASDNAAQFGADSARIALVGDSAGGNLAAALSLLLREEGGPAVRFQALLYPATDLDTTRWPSMEQCATGYLATREMLDWYHRHYVTENDRRNPLAAPIHADDLGGLPPTFLATAEFDILRDEGEAFAARLAQAGVLTTLRRYQGQIHGFYRFPAGFEGTDQLRRDVVDALHAGLAHSPAESRMP